MTQATHLLQENEAKMVAEKSSRQLLQPAPARNIQGTRVQTELAQQQASVEKARKAIPKELQQAEVTLEFTD